MDISWHKYQFTGEEHELPLSGSFKIGRAPSCNVTVTDERVSSVHFSISVSEKTTGKTRGVKYNINDQSRNGTWLLSPATGLRRLQKGNFMPVNNKDIILLLQPMVAGRDIAFKFVQTGKSSAKLLRCEQRELKDETLCNVDESTQRCAQKKGHESVKSEDTIKVLNGAEFNEGKRKHYSDVPVPESLTLASVDFIKLDGCYETKKQKRTGNLKDEESPLSTSPNASSTSCEKVPLKNKNRSSLGVIESLHTEKNGSKEILHGIIASLHGGICEGVSQECEVAEPKTTSSDNVEGIHEEIQEESESGSIPSRKCRECGKTLPVVTASLHEGICDGPSQDMDDAEQESVPKLVNSYNDKERRIMVREKRVDEDGSCLTTVHLELDNQERNKRTSEHCGIAISNDTPSSGCQSQDTLIYSLDFNYQLLVSSEEGKINDSYKVSFRKEDRSATDFLNSIASECVTNDSNRKATNNDGVSFLDVTLGNESQDTCPYSLASNCESDLSEAFQKDTKQSDSKDVMKELSFQPGLERNSRDVDILDATKKGCESDVSKSMEISSSGGHYITVTGCKREVKEGFSSTCEQNVTADRRCDENAIETFDNAQVEVYPCADTMAEKYADDLETNKDEGGHSSVQNGADSGTETSENPIPGLDLDIPEDDSSKEPFASCHTVDPMLTELPRESSKLRNDPKNVGSKVEEQEEMDKATEVIKKIEECTVLGKEESVERCTFCSGMFAITELVTHVQTCAEISSKVVREEMESCPHCGKVFPVTELVIHVERCSDDLPPTPDSEACSDSEFSSEENESCSNCGKMLKMSEVAVHKDYCTFEFRYGSSSFDSDEEQDVECCPKCRKEFPVVELVSHVSSCREFHKRDTDETVSPSTPIPYDAAEGSIGVPLLTATSVGPMSTNCVMPTGEVSTIASDVTAITSGSPDERKDDYVTLPPVASLAASSVEPTITSGVTATTTSGSPDESNNDNVTPPPSSVPTTTALPSTTSTNDEDIELCPKCRKEFPLIELLNHAPLCTESLRKLDEVSNRCATSNEESHHAGPVVITDCPLCHIILPVGMIRHHFASCETRFSIGDTPSPHDGKSQSASLGVDFTEGCVSGDISNFGSHVEIKNASSRERRTLEDVARKQRKSSGQFQRIKEHSKASGAELQKKYVKSKRKLLQNNKRKKKVVSPSEEINECLTSPSSSSMRKKRKEETKETKRDFLGALDTGGSFESPGSELVDRKESGEVENVELKTSSSISSYYECEEQCVYCLKMFPVGVLVDHADSCSQRNNQPSETDELEQCYFCLQTFPLSIMIEHTQQCDKRHSSQCDSQTAEGRESMERCMYCFKDFPIAKLIRHAQNCDGDMSGPRERFAGFLPSVHDLSAFSSVAALTDTQQAALQYVIARSAQDSNSVAANLLKRVKKLGYNHSDLQKTLHWIRSAAPIIIHIDLNRVLQHLVKDTHYRNRFETGTSSGCLDMAVRKKWEDRIFNKFYHGSCSTERVKYGVLNIVGDPKGVKTCITYGDSFLQLKMVRLRTTFASMDTSGTGVKLSCCEHYANVLYEYTDQELKAVQIHGPVSLSDNVECIVVNSRHKHDHQTISLLDEFIKQNKCNLIWMDDEE